MVTDDPIFPMWEFLEDFSGHLEGFSGNSSSAIGRTSIQATDHARTEFVQPGESYTVRGFSSIEDDEVIAHELQEEFVVEGSERAQNWSEWAGPFTDIWSTDGAFQNDYNSTSNCSYDSGEDNEQDRRPEISDHFATFDGEIQEILNLLDPIPHIPRTNGEIPTTDDASAAHSRLLDRLMQYKLRELKVDGDGNCQFCAFSDQLYRTPEHHKSVRKDVVSQLKAYPEYYEGYVPMKYSDYVKKMAKSGEWGDHVTLQAAADYYGVEICLLTSFKDTSFIRILPKKRKSKRVIYLSFWAEVHYNSIYPDGDIPHYSGQKKKGIHFRQYLKDKLKI
ncbi:hypothetical protein KP509_01G054900 [Ceratopteris richardii]|uniref:ubiquitinyl hydrolase 1 n=1 Tax=Ceratopteris richardii TaxID=49495 RepID=A0A8T2VLH4_CERRI|nr:hypothetical protein KP509_01G054900 [Ceratopteris richardii]KAH7446426.1 hypothetical protein KP509_01G054900 [Ceratopteris richardii]